MEEFSLLPADISCDPLLGGILSSHNIKEEDEDFFSEICFSPWSDAVSTSSSSSSSSSNSSSNEDNSLSSSFLEFTIPLKIVGDSSSSESNDTGGVSSNSNSLSDIDLCALLSLQQEVGVEDSSRLAEPATDLGVKMGHFSVEVASAEKVIPVSEMQLNNQPDVTADLPTESNLVAVPVGIKDEIKMECEEEKVDKRSADAPAHPKIHLLNEEIVHKPLATFIKKPTATLSFTSGESTNLTPISASTLLTQKPETVSHCEVCKLVFSSEDQLVAHRKSFSVRLSCCQ